jgi:hypothetical protein
MPDPVEPLIVDLLEWIGRRPRPYAEVLEAWRTSCPRLPVWEEANERGFIEHLHGPGRAALVVVSALGMAHLERHSARATQLNDGSMQSQLDLESGPRLVAGRSGQCGD